MPVSEDLAARRRVLADGLAERLGEETLRALGVWAFDVLHEPPETIATGTTRLGTSLVEDGRQILERAGWDWRAFKRHLQDGRKTSAQNARRRNS